MAEVYCGRLRDDRCAWIWLVALREMNHDIALLKQQKQILLYMIGEITYLHRPMEEIFDLIALKADPPYNLFLAEIAQKMKERDGRSLIQLWNEAVHDRQDKTELSQTGKSYLLKMGNCFEYEENSFRWRRWDCLKQNWTVR